MATNLIKQVIDKRLSGLQVSPQEMAVINFVRDTSGDVDTLVRPLGHEVPEKEAIEIAREAIIKTIR